MLWKTTCCPLLCLLMIQVEEYSLPGKPQPGGPSSRGRRHHRRISSPFFGCQPMADPVRILGPFFSTDSVEWFCLPQHVPSFRRSNEACSRLRSSSKEALAPTTRTVRNCCEVEGKAWRRPKSTYVVVGLFLLNPHRF